MNSQIGFYQVTNFHIINIQLKILLYIEAYFKLRIKIS